jgi:CheY-like chemotaxis protein
MLEHTGEYVVCEENNPTRALQTSRSFKPDLILLDIAMPEEDGIEVAAQIEADWTLYRVPMVCLTGLVTRTEVADGYQIQGRQVTAKPIRGADLIRVSEKTYHVAAPTGDVISPGFNAGRKMKTVQESLR